MNRISKTNLILENHPSSLTSTITAKPYSSTTQNITVNVWPEFVDSKFTAAGDLFIWAYHVMINNQTDSTVRLVKRHWKITDEIGNVQEIDGDGVIGQQPSIAPNTSYKYSSGVHLNFPSGIMSGTYKMQKDNGEFFDVEIPLFSLDIPNQKEIIN
jgi:ApaG protein